MKKLTIMFPCVGRRVSLVRSFAQACRDAQCQAVLVGTDRVDTAPALDCCDVVRVAPPVAHPDYRVQTLALAREMHADLVVPTIDLDLKMWAALRDTLAAEGCRVLIADEDVVNICEDKREMFRFLRAKGFDTPESMTAAEALQKKEHTFPYFLKPWDGHASRGNAVVHDLEELRFYAARIPNCLVQEFIDGQEHTVDVFVDFAGQVRCIVPRRRIEVRAGEVSKGITVRHEGVITEVRRLAEALHPGPGVTTIQCFLTPDEQVKFIEINPRFGGGAPLAIAAGADFPGWLVQMCLGQTPTIDQSAWRDGLMMLRYDEAIWRQT